MPPGDPEGRGLDFQYQGESRWPASRGTYRNSYYLHHRYEQYPITGGQAPVPIMVKEAQELMKAEGLYRTGDGAGAAEIVNATRVTRGNLPPATAADDDLLDKIIYEYRIENFFVCPGCAFFTRRAWGELAATGPDHHQGPVVGTPRHFAVPGQELEILQKPIYTYGGIGAEGTSLEPAPNARLSQGTVAPVRVVYSDEHLRRIAELGSTLGGRSVLASSVSALTRQAGVGVCGQGG